ncbi:hypothetical protein RN001_010253 [Aquatica leii]|uniref:Luciferin 4-monooxygenase n=1 Tax=Aquatica leii TaxID=1421715 RepID=A0AAN7PW70_9COLE|nr:hypothetical protein RN001_010253 [Aquatica leii]
MKENNGQFIEKTMKLLWRTPQSINVDDKIIHVPKSAYIPDPRGLGYTLFYCMQKHKDKIAQIDGITGEKDTFRSLLQRCVQTALKMRCLGITPNDIVTTCTFNHLNSCVPYLATLFLGAKIANFDPTLSLQDIVRLMRQVMPKLIFVIPEAFDLIKSAVKELNEPVHIVVFGPSDEHTSFCEFLEPSKEESEFKPHETVDLKDTALILFSSGTSGLPKGICINHYGFMHQQMNLTNMGFCLDIILSFSSLYWATTSALLSASIFVGGARLIIPKFDTPLIWTAIDKFKPTLIYGSPFHYQRLYDAKPLTVDVSSVKQVGVGGSNLLKNRILVIRSMFPTARLCGGYGQTEMAMLITIFSGNQVDDKFILAKPTSCGFGVPGISYKVVDIETEEILGPNQQGELRLKTDYCLNGYYNLDASDCWDKDGWYQTYDLVYYDKDKCFYVVDRLKEFLKFQSWHVPPSFLESILVTHQDVSDAVVIGLPHDLDGCHLLALVVLKNPNSGVTPKELEKYVEKRVDDTKRLRGGVKIIKKIPSTEIGKIDGITGEKDTYRSLLQRCVRTALKMRCLGITTNDIVTTCTFNHLNSCVPYLATLFLGAKIANFDLTLSLQDIVRLMRQVMPKLIFVIPEAFDLIKSAVKELNEPVHIVVFGPSDEHTSFCEFLEPSKEESEFKPHETVDLKDTALILFSSGTSGLPKGICINHYGFMHQQMNLTNMGFCLDIILSFSSLYWVTTSAFLSASIFVGGARLIIPKFDTPLIWTTIDKFKPTLIYGSPFHYQRLYDAKPLTVDVSSVKQVGVGGSNLLKNRILIIRGMFPTAQLCCSYGQTEMAMLITIFSGNQVDDKFILAKPTSCGFGVPGISYKVVDIETEEILGPNQQGELRLKTDYCLNGYYNLDASDCWDKDGWYRTYDLVYYDKDKCFYVVDRLKEFLKFQSCHVSPSFLESILVTHQDVSDAVVIGLPHDLDGCHLLALVVLKNPNSGVTPKELEKYVEERVDDTKRLRGGVKIIKKIPSTEIGKVQRRKIRDMHLRGEI